MRAQPAASHFINGKPTEDAAENTGDTSSRSSCSLSSSFFATKWSLSNSSAS